MTTRQRRYGVTYCAKCGTRHANVNHHEDGTLVTADDRPDLTRDILAAYAAVDGHASMIAMKDAICPRPAPRPGRNPKVVDRRTREGREWDERVLLVMTIEFDLCDRGLMRVVDEPRGEHSWGLAITDEGRAYLAAAIWEQP
jgi:hypothetical protein